MIKLVLEKAEEPEIKLPASTGSWKNQESSKQDKPKAKHPKTYIIKLTKIKHKEQILKAAREKQQITHKGIPIKITAFNRNSLRQEGMAGHT